jgi:hypothetical protein
MAELRPLTFGEILDGALTLYRRHFGLFLQLSIAVLAIPVALYGYFLLPLLGEQLMLAMMMDKVGTGLRLGVFGALLYFGSLILTAATVRVVSDSYLGRTPALGASLKVGLSKIWPLFVVALGKGVVVGGLTGLFAGSAIVTAFLLDRGGAGAGAMAAGIAIVFLGAWLVSWVASGYGVTTQVVVLGPVRRGLEAFGQSWRLTRGARRKVFGLGVVAFLLFNLVPTWIFQILGLVLGPANPVLATTMIILQLVVPMILAPAIGCVFTLMYYDLRVRREAFDLQMLGQQLGSA